MSTIIAVSNQKGGVGKTTTAINLSCAVAKRGRKVLLLDLDPQGNATSGLGTNKAETVFNTYTVLIGHSTVQETALKTEVEGLFLLPAGIDLAGAEVELLEKPRREYVLKNALSAVKDLYDYVFIDCPPSLSVLTLNALTAADKVLVPIQCEFFALEGLGQLMNTVRLVKQHLNKGLEVDGVVCTMYDGRTNLSSQVVAEVKRYFADKVYSTPVPRNIRLAEAPSYGQPIEVFDASCTGAEAYRRLAAELLERNETSAKTQVERKG